MYARITSCLQPKIILWYFFYLSCNPSSILFLSGISSTTSKSLTPFSFFFLSLSSFFAADYLFFVLLLRYSYRFSLLTGCFDDPPLPPAQVTMTLSVDYRSEDGVILYACPTDMATLDNVTIQNVTCTRRYPQFVFWPQTVQECLGK